MSRYLSVIFTSTRMADQALMSLKASCLDALCLRLGDKISIETADYFCDGGNVTRFSLMTSPVTGGTYIKMCNGWDYRTELAD